MWKKVPFEGRASGYYSHLGAPERKACAPLKPIEGDGVVGAMSAHWEEWKKLGAPRLVVQWLRQGVPLRWKGAPPKQKVVLGNKQPKEVEAEMDKLVEAGAFVRQECKVSSPTFIIPKRDGTNRLIHDLRQINSALDAPSFTLRGAQEAADVVRASGALVTLDLRRGYQQVAVAEEARAFLGAQWRGTTVASTVLPFGLSISPYIFTRITGWLARMIRKSFGLHAAVYIDDFLIGAKDKETLEAGLVKVKELFGRLGVILSPKTSHIPRAEVEYLGFVWNADKKTVSITSERRKEYRRKIKNLLRTGQSRKVWLQTIGKLLFLREVVGPALRHVRSLMHQTRRRAGEKLVEAAGEAREDLLWWLETLAHPVSFSLNKVPVSAAITTDASSSWLGGTLEFWGEDGKKDTRDTGKQETEGSQETMKEGQVQGKEIDTNKDQERKVFQVKSKDPDCHINIKELEALYRAIKENKEDLRGRSALWFTDSVTAKAAIARQGTQGLGQEAWTMTKKILDLLQEQKISLLPRHVLGRLNCQADSLSRPGEERDSWETALMKITNTWGPLQEDPWGFTKEPKTIVETLEWRNKRSLLVPPVSKIPETLDLLERVRGIAPRCPPTAWEQMAVLVTPLWRGSAWWPRLETMREEWIQLGRLPHRGLRRWMTRNGHWADWTASLIAVGRDCGPREQ